MPFGNRSLRQQLRRSQYQPDRPACSSDRKLPCPRSSFGERLGDELPVGKQLVTFHPAAISDQRSRGHGLRHGTGGGTKVAEGATDTLQGVTNAALGLLAVEGHPACHPVLPRSHTVPKTQLLASLALAGLEFA